MNLCSFTLFSDSYTTQREEKCRSCYLWNSPESQTLFICLSNTQSSLSVKGKNMNIHALWLSNVPDKRCGPWVLSKTSCFAIFLKVNLHASICRRQMLCGTTKRLLQVWFCMRTSVSQTRSHCVTLKMQILPMCLHQGIYLVPALTSVVWVCKYTQKGD